MPSINKVIVIGNLGKDPEVRYTPSGAAVANATVATNRSWKSKESGEKVEETEFHRVVFYDRLAEIAGEYLRKGKPVYVEGRLKTRKWKDKDGRDVYTTEIIAEQLQMLSGRDEAGDGGGQKDKHSQDDRKLGANQRREPPSRAPAKSHQKSSADFDDIDSDMPF